MGKIKHWNLAVLKPVVSYVNQNKKNQESSYGREKLVFCGISPTFPSYFRRQWFLHCLANTLKPNLQKYKKRLVISLPGN